MTAELIKTAWFSYNTSTPPSMRMWARTLTSREEVPSGFQDAFPASSTEEFPYTVLIPEEHVSPFHKKRNATLLSLYEDKLVILESVRGKVVSTAYPFNATMYLEHGRVLLKSWLKISSPWHSTTVMFNTVNEKVLEPIIEAIRPAVPSDAPEKLRQARHQQELSKFSYLWKMNFKHFNLSRQSIQPGEHILESVYQPEIHLNTLNLFGRPVFSKYLTGHLAVLTDKELILIKESQHTKSLKEPLFGAIYTYIPRSQIKNVSFQCTTGKTDYAMNVTLADNTRLRAEFATESAVNLELFKDACSYNFIVEQA